MKYRNGFVSNSSSCSFIINAENKFSTVKDVAKYIMEVYDHEYFSRHTNELNNLNNLKNPDTPVYFDTGGDPTYIRKYDNKIIILTTQNITFWNIKKVALSKFDLSDEFYNYFNFTIIDPEEWEYEDHEHKYIFNDPADFYGYYKKFNDFLILEHNFFGKTCYIQDCPKCNRIINRGWVLNNGKKICNCKINGIIRLEKLNNINNHEK
jgi:hypothetical protein